MNDPTSSADLRATLRQKRALQRVAVALFALNLTLLATWLVWTARIPYLAP